MCGKAGTATFHHVRLLHGSTPNSKNKREMVFYEFAAADAWPLAGDASYMHKLCQAELWADMQSSILLGKATLTHEWK